MTGSSRVTASRCNVRNSKALAWYSGVAGGIYATENATVDLWRTTVSGNTCKFGGGGVHARDAARVTLSGCTVYGNTSDDGWNVATEGNGLVTLLNSIVWLESATAENVSGTVIATYCDISGASTYTGDGNINADPLFGDAAAGDFTLGTSSPCIDTGDPASPNDADLTRADMGAFPAGGDVSVEGDRPVAFGLAGNYPNPFNPVTSIAFSTGQTGHVRLSIYNVAGQLVRTLVDDRMAPGVHEVVWDGRDMTGRAAGSGLYVCRLVSHEGALARRMMLVK